MQGGTRALFIWTGPALLSLLAAPAVQAQTPPPGDVDSLRHELAAAKAQIARQEERLRALEARLDQVAASGSAATAPVPPVPGAIPGTQLGGPVEQVGAAPDDFDQPPSVAVLGDQGSVLTRAGQLTTEFQADYTRLDRNRALFRGISIAEAVLIGAYDINESRQDILTASIAARYGLSRRFEIGVRVPYVYRADTTILAPVQSSGTPSQAFDPPRTARDNGIGDIEFQARYQLTRARPGRAFLVANLQAVAPTGTDPFKIRRSATGNPLEAATGAGFWSVSPSVTAILPTDPAVLFGTIGYGRNFGRSVDAQVGGIQVLYVNPGDQISASAGIGLSLNERTSFNLGYAHTWSLGTFTRTRPLEPANSPVLEMTSRDLQIGRLLFGVSYRATQRLTLNWSVEVGATQDAPDMRTVLRVPFELLSGRP
ncbi:transporter [Sphingomonas aerophila]|uniref:Transporter n=1 Tax=Sphingomonas aerophila TaxID=1344948 RepID=A0A7W9EV48_9SPHN|nr:transporter [Sphingomonas aerophila]MBB5714352.1 hypothetical protein [Sphingomonas aerophila]